MPEPGAHTPDALSWAGQEGGSCADVGPWPVCYSQRAQQVEETLETLKTTKSKESQGMELELLI